MSPLVCCIVRSAALIRPAACTEILLSKSQISNDGVAALASALRGGELPSCVLIDLDDNPGSDAPMKEALRSPERAAALARHWRSIVDSAHLPCCK